MTASGAATVSKETKWPFHLGQDLPALSGLQIRWAQWEAEAPPGELAGIKAEAERAFQEFLKIASDRNTAIYVDFDQQRWPRTPLDFKETEARSFLIAVMRLLRKVGLSAPDPTGPA